MRVLLRLPRWVGDVVMAQPTVAALEARFGEALTVAGAVALLDLLRPGLTRARLQPCGRRPDPRTWRGHDAALLLDGSAASAWIALRAGIPRRIAWCSGGRAPLLTEGMVPPRERGRTPLGRGRRGRWPRRLPRPCSASCAEIAGLLGVAVPDLVPRLVVDPRARAAVRARRGHEQPFLLLQAGARPGSAKGHPPERWAAVLAALRARGLDAPVWALAGPGEEWAARAVAEASDARAVVDPVADLRELAAWCAQARVVLGCDGGSRLVARAVGARRVTLFGPTDPRHTTDMQVGETVLRVNVPCGPCHLERCPIEGTGRLDCHLALDPERIAAAVLEGWEASAPSSGAY